MENIRVNYRILDLLFQKEKNNESIDYRLLLGERIRTLTPTKHPHKTPRAFHNKVKKDNNKEQKFSSHRILDFDQETVNQPSSIKHK